MSDAIGRSAASARTASELVRTAEAAKEIKTPVEQSAAAASAMSEQARQLSEVVRRFRLG